MPKSRAETIELLGGGPQMHAATAVLPPSLEVAPDAAGLALPGDVPVRARRLLDFCTLRPTDSELIRYGRETTRDDLAAETADGTEAPEAEYVVTPEEARVRTIPVWIPAHRSNLADQAELEALLEGRLGGSVRGRLQRQIVQGDGVAPNLEGILATSGIGTVTRDTTNETRFAAIGRGVTEVRVELEDEPNAIAIHPVDYGEVIGELGGSGTEVATRTLHGVPAVPTTAAPEGTAVVGAFDVGLSVRVREGLALSVSDSHDDLFAKRMKIVDFALRIAAAGKIIGFTEEGVHRARQRGQVRERQPPDLRRDRRARRRRVPQALRARRRRRLPRLHRRRSARWSSSDDHRERPQVAPAPAADLAGAGATSPGALRRSGVGPVRPTGKRSCRTRRPQREAAR